MLWANQIARFFWSAISLEETERPFQFHAGWVLSKKMRSFVYIFIGRVLAWGKVPMKSYYLVLTSCMAILVLMAILNTVDKSNCKSFWSVTSLEETEGPFQFHAG